MAATQYHLVLLGDSIFDNAAYVPGEAAVIDHINDLLPPNWQATLAARDGDVAADVAAQLSVLPEGATHLVVSVGGNDALMALNVFSLPVATVNDALGHLAIVRKDFQHDFREMLRQVLAHRLPLAVCTIYDAIPGLSVEAQTALAIFNDTIVREALAVGARIIDLRMACTENTDYSAISPIEPSVAGGRKIAHAIAVFVLGTMHP